VTFKDATAFVASFGFMIPTLFKHDATGIQQQWLLNPKGQNSQTLTP